jgi:hypothetical protein
VPGERLDLLDADVLVLTCISQALRAVPALARALSA